MANVVSSQLIEQGPRNLIYELLNLSDGTQETAVKKIDPAALGYANPFALRVRRIISMVGGAGVVSLFWEATTPVKFANLSGYLDKDLRNSTALINPTKGQPGATGAILLTTTAFAANSSYDIWIELAAS